MQRQELPQWEKWGRFKFSVIGGLLSSPPATGELQARLRLLAEQVYQHPLCPGSRLQPGFSTIERWYYRARKAADPIAVLGRKTRADHGFHRVLAAEVVQVLTEQYREHPRWSVQLHYDNLVAVAAKRPELQPLPGYQTIRRYIRSRGWVRSKAPARPTDGQQRAAQRLSDREVRSFEATHVHALWHLDFHQAKLKIIDRHGRWHTPVALAIIDDHSRLCCHIQFYLAENSENLIHGLSQACWKRGLPRALLTDNGSAMLAEETREGLARLGIEHKTTLPYSPYQNGKQEVLWAQLEGRLLEMLRGCEPLRLEFLNQATQAWVEQDYHHRQHRETKATPLQRLLQGPRVDRPAPNAEQMRLAFARRVVRTQRRSDGTVSVEGTRYEVPGRFRHLLKLTLGYQSWDKSRVQLLDAKSGALLAQLLPQDKAANAAGRRRALEPEVNTQPATISGNRENPPLLQQWLADYAATGCPAPYLPKDELSEEHRHER